MENWALILQIMSTNREKIISNKESLKKFKDVLQKEFGLQISDDVAMELKDRLLKYYQLLYDIYKKNPNKIEELLGNIDKSKVKL